MKSYKYICIYICIYISTDIVSLVIPTVRLSVVDIAIYGIQQTWYNPVDLIIAKMVIIHGGS